MDIDLKTVELFNFLKQNRKYNHELQQRFYHSAISPYKRPEEKIINLLYLIANTQSQPKINSLSEFFKHIHTSSENLKTFTGFVQLMNNGKPTEATYKNLYYGFVNQPGWGNKTAALLCKSIFHLHNAEYGNGLKIWDDAPASLLEQDKLYLPVDAVIISIFYTLEENGNWNFKSINNYLQDYSADEIEIWDDLWFWGFITQKGSDRKRINEWNENKYWTLRESNKTPATILEIKDKAKKFLDIIESKSNNEIVPSYSLESHINK